MTAAIHFMNYDVGSHVGFNGILHDSLLFAISNGMRTCQIFMGDQISLSRTKIGINDILTCQKIQKRFPTHFFSHFPFTASLCGSVNSLVWNGDSAQDNKTLFMLKQLEYELSVFANFATDITRSGVVIHPGCNSNTRNGLLSIAKSINKINFSQCANLVLENSAGEGKKLCKNFEELSIVFKAIDPQKLQNVSVCIDTAHIHGQGDFDLSNVDNVDKMFEQFDEKIGLKHLSLIHLNDSKAELGSKKDRHECLKQGKIWSDDDSALRHLIERAEFLKVPMVMETELCDVLTVSALL